MKADEREKNEIKRKNLSTIDIQISGSGFNMKSECFIMWMDSTTRGAQNGLKLKKREINCSKKKKRKRNQEEPKIYSKKSREKERG